MDYTSKILKIELYVEKDFLVIDNSNDDFTSFFLNGGKVFSAPSLEGDSRIADLASVLMLGAKKIGELSIWISLNSDKTQTFIATIASIEQNKTVMELSMWAYEQWKKKQSPVIVAEE